MLQITDKEMCCGCNACVQACPASCIKMVDDGEGFSYPKVDVGRCIDCGMCEKVCPMINPYQPREAMEVYAARSMNTLTRENSSSGGVFMELARWVLGQGGVVFGAHFTKDWEVEHASAQAEEGVRAFCGSKYVESRVGETFKEAREYLKQDRWVLFSGTSCHISALNHFLRKEYDKLLTVEVVCHGVPGTKLWHAYLDYITGKQTKGIRDIRFRSKEMGWKNYSFVCDMRHHRTQETFRRNPYMRAFLSDSLLRPSCYSCACKMFATESDLALADYWGVWHIQPEADDDRGTGLVFVHTQKARKALEALPVRMDKVVMPIEKLREYNPAIGEPARRPMRIKRKLFYEGMKAGLPFPWLVDVIAKKRGIVGTVKQLLKR